MSNKKEIQHNGVTIGTSKLHKGTKLHFVGIGGIGMSGIAQIYNACGYRVQGSDSSCDYTKDLLEDCGINYFVGHSVDNIDTSISCVIRSSAIRNDNPEIVAAKDFGVPIISRAEALAGLIPLHTTSIAVTGTHGKTTTTAMIGSLLHHLGTQPTVVNGGLMHNFGNNILVGSGEIIALEADESDGSFLFLPCTTTVITNLEPEHLEYYGTIENLRNQFKNFIMKMSDRNAVVLCIDDSNLFEIWEELITLKVRAKIIPYSLNLATARKQNYCSQALAQNILHAENIRVDRNGTYFDLVGTIYNNTNNKTESKNRTKSDSDINSYMPQAISYKNIMIKTYGLHNVSNAIAAVAGVGAIYDLDEAKTKTAFATFTGVKRRFSILGQINGITVIDDYAHHGTEITATVAMAKLWLEQNNQDEANNASKYIHKTSTPQSKNKPKLIAIFQPHRYSRTKDLMDHFTTTLANIAADYLILLPIYSAGEEKIDNVSSRVLYHKILAAANQNPNGSKPQVLLLNDESNLASIINEVGNSGDMLLCMGAGSISKIAYDLVNPKEQ